MVVWDDNHSNDSVINPLQCILLHIFTVHGAGFLFITLTVLPHDTCLVQLFLTSILTHALPMC